MSTIRYWLIFSKRYTYSHYSIDASSSFFSLLWTFDLAFTLFIYNLWHFIVPTERIYSVYGHVVDGNVIEWFRLFNIHHWAKTEGRCEMKLHCAVNLGVFSVCIIYFCFSTILVGLLWEFSANFSRTNSNPVDEDVKLWQPVFTVVVYTHKKTPKLLSESMLIYIFVIYRVDCAN